jgi:pyridine nucleotide-disulfide oxidoreductase family protein
LNCSACNEALHVKRLILAGSGHAHLALLRALASHPLPAVQAVLVAPSRYEIYSGMVPGWIAGHFTLNEIRVDLLPLCRAANVRLIAGRIVGMDAGRRHVACSTGEHLDYDLLSLDIGGEIDLSWLQPSEDRLIAARPFHSFVPRWQQTVQAAQTAAGFRLVVVGGGAGGVEIALAARHAFAARGLDASVDLIASESGVLNGHAPAVSRRIRRLAARFGVRIHDERAVGAGNGLLLSNAERLLADRIVAATGVRPARWLRLSKLSLDEQGYIIVDSAHRSVSHPEVFAAGDVCSRQDVNMERSGVHAVHAGAILARNVVAAVAGGSMCAYRPRRRSLYLLATGPRYAVASWGSWSGEGAWVWYWKRWIDRRFIRSFGPIGSLPDGVPADDQVVENPDREGQE